MPTPALLQSATAALGEVLKFDRPADQVLRGFFRAHHQLGQRDRAFVAESAFLVVRNLRLLQTLGDSAHPRRLLLCALSVLAGHSLRQLEPLLRKGEAPALAAVRGAAIAQLPPAVQLSLPDWIWERLCAEHSEETALQLARSLLQPAPLDLRVNTLSASREEVLAQLASEQSPAAATPYSPIGVRLDDKPALQSHPLFLQGKVEVQDEASQLLGFLVAPRRREMVVDFCAGAGGKTLALGALMRSQGRLYAFDTSQRRLANLDPRLKRSGLSNVHAQHIDSETDRRIARLAGKIDRVLVDAPCSGLGTLRRNPDLKWRQSPAGVTELAHKQRSILRSAARLVKPGGRLVYATCSLLREENEAVVDDFLAASPQFRGEHAGELLRSQDIALDTGPAFRVFPHLHAMDGFFAVALTREA